MVKSIKTIFVLTIAVLFALGGLSGVAMAADLTETEGQTTFTKKVVVYNMDIHIDDNGVEYFPIQVYTAIDSLSYKEVGMSMTVSSLSGSFGARTQTKNTKTVYTRMVFNDPDEGMKYYSASTLGGAYIYGHQMLFMANNWTGSDVQIAITPYAIDANDNTIYGSTIYVTDAEIDKRDPGKTLFAQKETITSNTETNVAIGDAIKLGDLFAAADGVTINSARVKVTVEGATYTPNESDWTQGTVVFDTTGTAKITVKDGYNIASTLTFEIAAIEKFTAKTVDSIEEGTTLTLGDIFETVQGVTIDSAKVTLDVSEGVTYVANESDWTQGNVTFDSEGTATVTINEGTNIPVTAEITVLPKPIEKFAATELDQVYAESTVTLGELFTAKDGVEIDSAKVTLDVSEGVTYAANESDWTQSTLTFDVGTATVTINEDINIPVSTSVTVLPIDKFTIKFENTDEYVYRVGSVNNVALGSLFSSTNADSESVTVTVTNKSGTASGTFTPNAADWTAATIKFAGTGMVEVTVSDANSNPLSLDLEVVNATNVTSYSGLGNRNSVLLDNITMPSGSYYISGATLYGNGFTFDVRNGDYTGSGYLSSNYLILMSNATIDNTKIVGAVYTKYGATVSSDYNRAAILCLGNNTITNSFVSNCAAPVRITSGNLEISDTILKGGNFANLDIRNGHVTLNNVTTINQYNSNDAGSDGSVPVGLGVVVYYEQVLDTTTIDIKGTFKQYNVLSESQAESIKDTSARTLAVAMFNSDYSTVQYNDGNDVWVNAGIISMTSGVDDDNVSDVSGYQHIYPVFQGAKGYLHTFKPDASSVSAVAPEYEATAQGAIAPSYSFDYTTKNFVEKTEGSNNYCYESDGTVHIAMDQGESFSWDTSILTVTKNGSSLDYTVSMNGTDYTGKSIVFDTSGTYVVEYTYSDPNNYTVDAEGNVTTYSVSYTKQVYISVAVIAPDAKNATFTFGSAGTSAKTVTIGNDTYVMPDVSGTSSTVGSITVSGTTVYYPIVNAYTSDGATEHSSFNSWYMCYPVFKNVVSITDYSDGGTGAEEYYNSSTTTMPANLSLIAYTQYYKSSSAPSGSVTFNTTGGAAKAFRYEAGNDAASTPTTLSNVLIYASPTLSNNARDEMYGLVKYQYTDNAGAIYNYVVGYHAPQTTVKSITCLAEGTLITLADGSQKKVEDITTEDDLLVFNHETGKYEAGKLWFTDHTGDLAANRSIINLKFSDGTVTRISYEHSFFDLDLMKYVFIREDNVSEYVGHRFVKTLWDGEEFTNGEVTLTEAYVTVENIKVYGPISEYHLNMVSDSLLTMPSFNFGVTGFINIFDYEEDLSYDDEKMAADIEKYGLFTYDDFSNVMSLEDYNKTPMPYFKVSIGKGYLTYEEIEMTLTYLAENGF